jgi:hypothetical protein
MDLNCHRWRLVEKFAHSATIPVHWTNNAISPATGPLCHDRVDPFRILRVHGHQVLCQLVVRIRSVRSMLHQVRLKPLQNRSGGTFPSQIPIPNVQPDGLKTVSKMSAKTFGFLSPVAACLIAW